MIPLVSVPKPPPRGLNRSSSTNSSFYFRRKASDLSSSLQSSFTSAIRTPSFRAATGNNASTAGGNAYVNPHPAAAAMTASTAAERRSLLTPTPSSSNLLTVANALSGSDTEGSLPLPPAPSSTPVQQQQTFESVVMLATNEQRARNGPGRGLVPGGGSGAGQGGSNGGLEPGRDGGLRAKRSIRLLRDASVYGRGMRAAAAAAIRGNGEGSRERERLRKFDLTMQRIITYFAT